MTINLKMDTLGVEMLFRAYTLQPLRRPVQELRCDRMTAKSGLDERVFLFLVRYRS